MARKKTDTAEKPYVSPSILAARSGACVIFPLPQSQQGVESE